MTTVNLSSWRGEAGEDSATGVRDLTCLCEHRVRPVALRAGRQRMHEPLRPLEQTCRSFTSAAASCVGMQP
eukprot:3257735-Prymnesium_polylepis.4